MKWTVAIMRCCWRSVSCLADLVHVHCNIRLMCISPISLCSRDSREVCSQECIIYSLYPQCLWHSIQTLLPSTKQGHEKTLVISAYSWRFRKISCNQFRARRRPNNTWTELFSSAESKGSTRQGKAEVMCTEKCALLNISISLRNDLNAHGIKHVVTEQKSPKTYTLCPKVLRTDYLINIKQCITWVNYIKER